MHNPDLVQKHLLAEPGAVFKLMPGDVATAEAPVRPSMDPAVLSKYGLLSGSYDIVFGENGVPVDYLNVIIEGYASTWTKDAAGDQYGPDSFPEEVLMGYLRHPVLLMDHEREKVGKVIGKITDLRRDQIGLWVRASVDNAPDLAGLRARIVSGTVNSFSISGLVDRANIFTRLDEISVVWVGCNAEAVFTVKGLDDKPAPEKSEPSKPLPATDVVSALRAVGVWPASCQPAIPSPLGWMDNSYEGAGAMLKEKIKSMRLSITELQVQKDLATDEKVKKDLAAAIQKLEAAIEAVEDELMSEAEAKKKEEAKAEEAKKKEEAAAKEAEEKAAKEAEACKEKEEAAQKAKDEEEAEAKKAVAKSLGVPEAEVSMVAMPNLIQGMTLQAKKWPKASQETALRVEKALKDKVSIQADMEFDDSPANIARLLAVASHPLVRKALANDTNPFRDRVAHAQANRIITAAIEGRLNSETEVRKALVGAAGTGDDMVPEELSNQLFIRLYGSAQVAPNLIQIPMESERIKISRVLAPANITGTPPATATSAAPDSTFTTAGDSDLMHAYPFEGYGYVWDDVQSDSVFNLISSLQQVMAVFLARQLDNSLINGNYAANIDNAYCLASDLGWATTASRTSAGVYVPVTSFWNGFRNLALNTSGLYTDINTKFTADPTTAIDEVLAKMKRYGTQQQAKNVCVVMGPGAIAKTRAAAAFKSQYAASVLWTMADGILDTYMGAKVIESYDMSEELSADGNYNPSTAAVQNLGSVLAFNRTQFAVGIRKTQVFEILRDPYYRRSNVRTVARFGFKSLEPTLSSTICPVSYGYKAAV